MCRADSLEKTVIDVGKDCGQRRGGQQRMRRLDGITNSVDRSFEQSPGDDDGQGGLGCRSPWGRKETDATYRLNNNIS